jgi:hypothetical protein
VRIRFGCGLDSRIYDNLIHRVLTGFWHSLNTVLHSTLLLSSLSCTVHSYYHHYHDHHCDLYKLSGEARSLSFKTLIRRQGSGCTDTCLLHLAVYKQRESQYLTFHSPVTQFIFSLNPQNQNLRKHFVPATHRSLHAVWSWRRPRLWPARMWVNNNLSNYTASHSGTPYSPTLTGIRASNL